MSSSSCNSPRPASSRIACGRVLMPTPSSRMVSDCSNSSQPMPRARSISAVVRPPIPPPTIIAVIAKLHAIPRRYTKALNSHERSLGRKRLCRLRLQLGPGLRLSLNFEVVEILPVAHAVAENLFLSRQILRRAEYILRAVPGGGFHRERRIDQMRATKRHQIRAAGGQDGIDLVGGRDVTDAHSGDTGLVANLIGEWRLEHAAIDRLRVAHGLAGGDVDQIDPGFGKSPRDQNAVIAGDAALGPISGRDTH